MNTTVDGDVARYAAAVRAAFADLPAPQFAVTSRTSGSTPLPRGGLPVALPNSGCHRSRGGWKLFRMT